MKELLNIQSELKAPKSQYNSFGKYYYRNQEDILEAAKPILDKYGLSLVVSDEIIEVSGTFMVKAKAIVTGKLLYWLFGAFNSSCTLDSLCLKVIVSML